MNLPSIKTCIASFKIPTVVNKTITEKRNVQIGSAILYSGLTQTIIPAINTPIVWMASPKTWIKAKSQMI